MVGTSLPVVVAVGIAVGIVVAVGIAVTVVVVVAVGIVVGIVVVVVVAVVVVAVVVVGEVGMITALISAVVAWIDRPTPGRHHPGRGLVDVEHNPLSDVVRAVIRADVRDWVGRVASMARSDLWGPTGAHSLIGDRRD